MQRETAEIVVIGAGVAGLGAADALSAEGVDVAVVEARDRVGGRIRSAPGLPPLEAGAEFIPQAGPAAELLRAAGGVFVGTPDRHAAFEDGRPVPLALGKALEALRGALAPYQGRSSADATLADALASSGAGAEAATLARRYVEQYHAAPAHEVSARWVAAVEGTEEGGGGGELVQSLDGLDRLPLLLAAGLPSGTIRLSTEASSVTASRGGVRVFVRDPSGEYQLDARAAVVAVPIAVLATGVPAIDPMPRALQAALDGLRPGRVVKIGLRFTRALWRECLQGAAEADATPKFIHADPPFPTWWTSADLDAPNLVAWAASGAAEALEGLAEDALVQAATEQLASLLKIQRREVRASLEQVVFHDWSADPWSRGAYTHAVPGGAGAAGRLASTKAPVLFAGEAASGAMGTVDGALASGRRVARRLLAARG